MEQIERNIVITDTLDGLGKGLYKEYFLTLTKYVPRK